MGGPEKTLIMIALATGFWAPAEDKKPLPPPVPNKADKAKVPAPPVPARAAVGASSVKAKDVVLVYCGDPKARKFTGEFFGLPVILGPYANGDKLQLMKDKKIYVFGEEGGGFKLLQATPLPSPPPEEEDRGSMAKHDFELLRSATRANGYQCDETGAIYWVGRKTLYVNQGKAWKARWAYPEMSAPAKAGTDLLDRGAVVVLPKNRVALFGGTDGFIKVIELGDEAKSPGKVIKTIGYDEIGCSRESYPSQARPAFCVFENCLYFYLHCTGRFFRMDLESFQFTDYDVPWAFQEFSEQPGASSWTNLGDADGTFPQTPASILFIPAPTGTLLACAMMFNVPVPSLRVFELNSESARIQAKVLENEAFPACLQYRNSKGELECIPEQ